MLMVALTSRMESEDTENITWLYLPAAKEQAGTCDGPFWHQ